jgi:hypothetical protein
MPVLADIFSAGNTLKRRFKDFAANPALYTEQMAGVAQEQDRELNTLRDLAFGDPKNPTKVTNSDAFRAYTERAMEGPLSFANMGITKVGGKTIRELLYGDKPNLNPAEKSAMTRFEKELKNPAVMRREEMRAIGGNIVQPTPEIVLLGDIGMHPEKLVGRTLVPVKGDLSGVGGRVTQIAGIPTERPTVRQGGRLYPQIQQNFDEDIGWAAELGAATNKIRNFEKYADENPLGVFVGMADTGIDFSHHMAEPLIGQLKAIDIPKNSLQAFNQAVRNTASETDKTKFPFKDFVGVDSPSVYEQIKDRGPLRKAIVKTMRKAEFTKLGFPRVEDMVAVMKEEGLMPNEAGRTFIEPILGRGPVTPTFKHGTYSTGIPARYAGGLLNAEGKVVGVPAPYLFSKTFAEKAAAGGTPANVHRSMELRQTGEKFTEEALDPLLQYLGYQ